MFNDFLHVQLYNLVLQVIKCNLSNIQSKESSVPFVEAIKYEWFSIITRNLWYCR